MTYLQELVERQPIAQTVFAARLAGVGIPQPWTATRLVASRGFITALASLPRR